MEIMMNAGEWLKAHDGSIRRMAKALFDHPETAGEELYAMEEMTGFLEKEGFTVRRGIAGIAAAFEASWGEGGPAVGFLAEYDALPGLGQESVPYYKPLEGPGHGCGHNLLGAGAVAAGCAMKAELTECGVPGRVVVYGCPEEEICRGKIVMAQAGCFDGLDAAVSWHPADKNQVSEEVFQAMVSKKFRFYGTTAHAASSPEKGRSALDAAEIMNVSVNYLREHVPSSVRMHYIYTNGGEKPNIVPDFAEVWYYIRAENTAVMRDADYRVELAAKGAAMATQTRVETAELIASPETKINYTLARTMEEVLEEIGEPRFDGKELAFANELHGNLGLTGLAVNTGIRKLTGIPVPMTGSTDVSAVSQKVPTVTLNTVCQVAGSPGHHWGITACAGSDFGFRGMLGAARIMAVFGCRLCMRPELVEEALKELSGAGMD